ncbi:TetR family transcriptional regulator [Streptomyces sp. NPDC058655]|uniref:TetR family transcriptional regulator n=1 Tax=unclassified Streptomyces TaxID=2593676 RepID=UPI00365173DB
MLMQERAARTRRSLVRAAAREFDRNGYAGSSLARITRSAGISMGALTFHFPNKEDLAAAVREQGHAATVAVVGDVATRREAPVQSVVSLTLALAELLESDVAVRAAARLSREQPGAAPDWASAWGPVIRERLRRPPRDRTGPADDWSTLAALAAHLVTGVEAEIRQRACHHEHLAGQSAAQLARVWELTLRGNRPARRSRSGPCPPR